MGFNFTQEQYRLIFTAVRRYQLDKTVLNSKEYHECNEILDSLFESAYAEELGQPV